MAQPEHLLIDGYNLIRAVPRFGRWERDSLEKARTVLEQALAEYLEYTGASLDLYYDGDGSVDAPPPKPRHARMRIFFSQRPQLADDLIMEAIQQQHGAKWLRVVSSDRQIRNFARRHKIRSTASDAYDAEMETPPPKPAAPVPGDTQRLRPPKADEIAEWERLFTEERDRFVEDDEVQPYRPAASAQKTPHQNTTTKKPATERTTPQKTTPKPKKQTPPAARPQRTPPIADRNDPRLNQRDIDDWERIFKQQPPPKDR